MNVPKSNSCNGLTRKKFIHGMTVHVLDELTYKKNRARVGKEPQAERGRKLLTFRFLP
jgi:hypothetical protein